MRIAGLLALAILLPVTAYAALVNINTANATLLDTLPGIGLSKAAAIIEYRTTHGPFVTIEDIQKVKGIGSGSTYAKIAPLVTVDATNAPTIVQPSLLAPSLNTVQTAKSAPPIISPKTNIQTHEEAVIAPTTTVEPAAVGAVSLVSPAPSKNIRATGLFHSPWTFGLLGVIVVAGATFIFL